MHCVSSNRPECVLYILSRLQSPAFIHFKVQVFAVLNTEPLHYAYEVDEGN